MSHIKVVDLAKRRGEFDAECREGLEEMMKLPGDLCAVGIVVVGKDNSVVTSYVNEQNYAIPLVGGLSYLQRRIIDDSEE